MSWKPGDYARSKGPKSHDCERYHNPCMCHNGFVRINSVYDTETMERVSTRLRLDDASRSSIGDHLLLVDWVGCGHPREMVHEDELEALPWVGHRELVASEAYQEPITVPTAEVQHVR